MYFRWLSIESRSILWKKFNDKLVKCALGFRVVLNLLQPFFKMTPPGKIPQFHLYFNNYFTSMDLIVHLQKLRLKCTDTIRENQIKEKNVIDKKASRGSYVVKHEQNSSKLHHYNEFKTSFDSFNCYRYNSIITFKKTV